MMWLVGAAVWALIARYGLCLARAAAKPPPPLTEGTPMTDPMTDLEYDPTADPVELAVKMAARIVVNQATEGREITPNCAGVVAQWALNQLESSNV